MLLYKDLIERGDEFAKQPVDNEKNTFLHVAARSGALKSIQVKKDIVCIFPVIITINFLLYVCRF